MGRGGLQRIIGGKDKVREMRGRRDPARRCARLNQDGRDLRGGDIGQRSPDAKMLADMVDRTDLGGIRDDAGRPVPYERIGVDAGPKRLADIDEFFHALIALPVRHQFVETVIRGIGEARRRHDVERHAAVGDVVERIEKARDVERVHEGRRIGEPEADMLRRASHRGDIRTHVVSRPADAPTAGGFMRTAPGARQTRAVAEKNHVELAALRNLHDVLEHCEIGKCRARPRSRLMPPSFEMRLGQVERQMHFRLHFVLPQEGLDYRATT